MYTGKKRLQPSLVTKEAARSSTLLMIKHAVKLLYKPPQRVIKVILHRYKFKNYIDTEFIHPDMTELLSWLEIKMLKLLSHPVRMKWMFA